MIKSNLLNVLKSFTIKEMKEFREFISSPFYNTNENVVKLFGIIRKYYPDFKSKSLDKKKVFSKIYTGEKYKDSKMRLLIFYLYELTEKFLINKNLYGDILSSKVLLLRELKKRSLSNSFEKSINETYKKLNETKVKDSGYLMNKFFIGIENFNYFSDLPNYKLDDKKSEDNPEEIFITLTHYYTLMSFSLYKILLTGNYLYESGFKADIFEKIINEFDKSKYSDYPEILCEYYLCMLENKSKDESNYYELKELIEKHKERLNPDTIEPGYIGLTNFCVNKIKAGERKFQGELFELYKNDLENKFYLEHGFMKHTYYRNIATTGAELEEFSWTRNFIEKYKNELQEEIKEPIYFYSLAVLETEQKNYEKALKYLSKIKTDEIYTKISIRVLQCRLFFELNWQEQLGSLVDASKHFLTNDKILPASQKEFYLGFFKFVYRLSQYRNSGNEHKFNLLKTKIESDDNLCRKDWLLMKINEYENQKGAN